MAMTLRLNPALAEQLRHRAQQTGQTQASLATEAITRLLAEPAEDDAVARLVVPAHEPYREVPPGRLIQGGPSLGLILDELRQDRL